MIKCKALSSFIARETSGYKAWFKMIDCVMYVIVQASVVRKIDSAIHFINLYPMESAPMDSAIIFLLHYPLLLVSLILIHLTEIYPMDSSIQLLNNRGLKITVCNSY